MLVRGQAQVALQEADSSLRHAGMVLSAIYSGYY